MNNKTKACDRVIQQVKTMIISGALTKGDMLPSESELSKTVGVSRATTRKALGMLAEMGLIETRWGVGSFVIVNALLAHDPEERQQFISEFKKDFRQAIRIKQLIDPEVAKYLALHAAPDSVAKMEAALDSMAANINNNFHYARAGSEFHLTMIRCLEIPFLTDYYQQLEEMESPTTQIVLLAVDDQIEIKQTDIRQHRRILNAIKAHDQDMAYYLTKEHLAFFYDYYENGLIMPSVSGD